MVDTWLGIHDWGLFIAAGLLLNLTPGADMALVARCSATQGFKAGAAAALGVSAGCWVHISAAALGLTALLAGSTMAFGVLRWAGAAYLVWLGWSLLRSHHRTPTPGRQNLADPAAAGHRSAAPPTGFGRLFAQGFLTNALNPKVALFFLAFMPQFIAVDAPHKALAFIVLGGVFVVDATAVNLLLAWGVATLRRRLDGRPAMRRTGLWLNRGVGSLFVALGLRLAWGGGGD
jgi:threonine/homoserine/homoserine lactone efflux protein